MDPAGILMLRSVRIIFEMIGLKPESMKFKKEVFNSNNLVKALTENPKNVRQFALSIYSEAIMAILWWRQMH